MCKKNSISGSRHLQYVYVCAFVCCSKSLYQVRITAHNHKHLKKEYFSDLYVLKLYCMRAELYMYESRPMSMHCVNIILIQYSTSTSYPTLISCSFTIPWFQHTNTLYRRIMCVKKWWFYITSIHCLKHHILNIEQNQNWIARATEKK